MLVVAGVIALTVAGTGVALAGPPPKLPANAEWLENTWQPAYDYDRDGCYPTPAVGPDRTINGGLKPTGSLSGNCHDRSDLDNSNGYSRYKCNNGWCAIAYTLYFEKDQLFANINSGHKHDWETVVVWLQDHEAKFVATSAHGRFTVHGRDSVQWLNGTRPKIVYHKEGAGSHAFRLASWGEAAENLTGNWHHPDLLGWSGLSADIRGALSGANFGKANFDLKDSRFADVLAKAKPAGISFNPHA